MGTPPRNEGLPLIGEYMKDNLNELGITKHELDQIRYKLMDSIKYDFTDLECIALYKLAMYDLLTSSECKSAVMLMAQKLGNIPIPKEDNE